MVKLLSNVAQISDSSEVEVPLTGAAKNQEWPKAVPQLNLRNIVMEDGIFDTESSQVQPQIKV